MDVSLMAGLAVAALALIGIGAWAELRGRGRRPALVNLADLDAAPQAESPAVRPGRSGTLARGFRAAARRHPAPALAVLETGFWLLALASLVDHLRAPREGFTAQLVWVLTIGPHEIGHVICIPFGWTLQIAGGSIWQLLFFALPALYAFVLRRQISASLFFWALTGHSFLNLAPYIGDARARNLPLLFGMGKDHHDWWNLLGHYGLLDYDHTFAALAVGMGAAILVWAAVTGLLAAWLLPRAGLGSARRFEGRFWRALWANWRAGGSDDSRV